MKIGMAIGTILFVLGILLGIIQLWFTPWSAELFLKLEMTLGALFLVVLVLWFVVKEYKENEINRSGNRLDHE